nr:protein phosphatase 2C 37-like [Tanacetum cinerariifolium]
MSAKLDKALYGLKTSFESMIKQPKRGISINKEKDDNDLLRMYDKIDSSVNTLIMPLDMLGLDLNSKDINESQYRGVNTFRNAIGTHYLPHSSEYVAPPSIDKVRPWFETIGYGEDVPTKGTLKKSLLPPRWRLLMAQIIQYLRDNPVAFKAPKPSSNVERAPQGNDASIAFTGEADPENSAPIDFVPQQLGNEDEDDEVHATENVETEDTLVPKSSSPIALPTKIKDLFSKFDELTEDVKELKKQVHELKIELPGDLKEIPTKLEEFTKTVTIQFASVQAKLKTLDALPDENAKAKAAKQEGEVGKAELVDLLGPEVVKSTTMTSHGLQVLRRLGSIFTLVYAAIQKLKKDSCLSSKEIKPPIVIQPPCYSACKVVMKCKERMHRIVKYEVEESSESLKWKETLQTSFSRMDKETTEWSEVDLSSDC